MAVRINKKQTILKQHKIIFPRIEPKREFYNISQLPSTILVGAFIIDMYIRNNGAESVTCSYLGRLAEYLRELALCLESHYVPCLEAIALAYAGFHQKLNTIGSELLLSCGRLVLSLHFSVKLTKYTKNQNFYCNF